MWKVRLWAAKVRKPSDTVDIGDIILSAEDGKVIKNDLTNPPRGLADVKAPPTTDYDVVVIGGALSGAATALMLLRERPDLRLLIIEKSPAFTPRRGGDG